MTIPELEKLSFDHPILFFDGHCVICNRFYIWVCKQDKERTLRYGRLSSSTGMQVQSILDLPDHPDTVILFENGQYWIESDVVFRVIKKLGGIYLIFYPLVVIPKVIRNPIYRWVSRNRYRWFGRLSTCMIPDQNQKDQFVDESL